MAMAKGSRSGKKARGRPRKKGPDSLDRVKGVKSLDAVLGISELNIEQDARSDEAEIEESELTDQISIQLDDVRTMSSTMELSEWIEAARNLEEDINLGKTGTPPILRSTEKEKLKQKLDDVGQGSKTMVKILDEDIEEEIEYWKPSIVGYVAGTNPPIHVLEGFVRRLWKEDVHKVGMISHGIFIIRFQSVEVRDKALNGGFIFLIRNLL